MYGGKASWYFVSIDKTIADEIKKNELAGVRRGFGSVPVTVRLGETTWKTSIFPDKSGGFLLPMKKSVREAEEVGVNDVITIVIRVRD